MTTTYGVLTAGVGTTQNSTSSSSSSSSSSSGQLNEQDFLNLLVAQLQYQDPLNPTSDTDMVAEEAQLSTVQGITQLDSSLQTMLSASLIGKTVSYTPTDSSTSQSGVVSGVTMSDGQTQLTIGSNTVDLSQVTGIQGS